MYIILVYDISISEKGQKRWNRVFKTCKEYLNHVQNSVFEGEILESDLFKLKSRLEREINKKYDSIIIFKTRNEKWLDREVIGIAEDNSLFI